MDFTTTNAPPVRVTINGTTYDVPRFLDAEFTAWAAARHKATEDKALAQFGDDAEARARFYNYFQPPPIDVVDLADETKTPEGTNYVIRTQLAKASVPSAVIESFVANVHPLQKRRLAWLLASAEAMAEAMRAATEDPGRGGDPLPAQPLTSGGLPTTTDATDSPSPATAGSTQAA